MIDIEEQNLATEYRSHAEINDLWERIDRYIDERIRRRRREDGDYDLAYEDGILATLTWLFGETEEHPYPEDE